MLRVHWFLLFLVIFSYNTYSGEDKNNHAAQSKQTADQIMRGTDDAPLTIKILPAQNSETNAAKEEKRSEKKSKEDSRIAWATIWLAVVTTILAVFTGTLWWATRKLVIDAKETSKRQLRAYVVIDKSKIIRLAEPSNTILVDVTMKNCGQTPAHDVSCHIDIFMDEADKIISHIPTVVPAEKRESVAIVGPQSTFEIKKLLTLTNEGEFVELIQGKTKIQVFVQIDYVDVFRIKQYFTTTSLSGDFFPSEETGLFKSLGHWALRPQKNGNTAT